MNSSYLIARVTTAEDVVPLSLLKAHSVVESDVDDDLILAEYRDAAVEHVEAITRSALRLSRYRFRFEELPVGAGAISLSVPPVRAVSSLSYQDWNGAVQTAALADYRVDMDSGFARIRPKAGTWPCGAFLELEAVSGYGAYVDSFEGLDYALPFTLVDNSPMGAEEIPRAMRMATLLLAAHWYENREATMPGISTTKIPHGVDALLFKFRNYKS